MRLMTHPNHRFVCAGRSSSSNLPVRMGIVFRLNMVYEYECKERARHVDLPRLKLRVLVSPLLTF